MKYKYPAVKNISVFEFLKHKTAKESIENKLHFFTKLLITIYIENYNAIKKIELKLTEKSLD